MMVGIISTVLLMGFMLFKAESNFFFYIKADNLNTTCTSPVFPTSNIIETFVNLSIAGLFVSILCSYFASSLFGFNKTTEIECKLLSPIVKKYVKSKRMKKEKSQMKHLSLPPVADKSIETVFL